METLRCPTCLSVLVVDGQKRCPSCRKKLGTRGRPIVLGESNRISAKPMLPVEFELHRRVEAENAAQDQRRRAAALAGSGHGSPPSAVFDTGEVAATRHSPKQPLGRERRRAAKPRHIEPPIEAPRVETEPEAPVGPTLERAARHSRKTPGRATPEPGVVEPPVGHSWVKMVEAAEAAVVEAPVVEPPVGHSWVKIVEAAEAGAGPELIDDVFTSFEPEFTAVPERDAAEAPVIDSWVVEPPAAKAWVEVVESAEAAVGVESEVVEVTITEPKIVFVPEAVEAVVVEPEVVVEAATAAESKIIFVPEGVEAVVVEPKPEPKQKAPRRRGRTPRSRPADAPEPAAREVVIPEVVFETEAAAASMPETEPVSDTLDLTAGTIPDIDLTAERTGQLATDAVDEGIDRRRPTRPNMFSATSRNPRVKKMIKGRRGWVVDYVIPETESEDTGS